MQKLSISVLGSFQVRLGDKLVTEQFRTEKERALLAYLVVEANQQHSREKLAELLWPGRPENTARTNLRQALSGVRKSIGDRESGSPFLEISDAAIQFRRSPDSWLDADAFRFNLIASREHTHPRGKACLECAQRLETAVELYKGEFMQEFFLPDCQALQEWILLSREQHHRMLVTALQELSETYQNLGDYETAQRYAWRMVNVAPIEESGHRQLMYLLAMSGRRSAALAQYQTLRRILYEELNVDPSQESTRLYEQIKAGLLVEEQRRAAPPSRPVQAISNLPVQLTSFINREKEIGWLVSTLSAPPCRFVSLIGPAGIGKTRLSVEASENIKPLFPDGVWFVPAENIPRIEALPSLIFTSLGIATSGLDDPWFKLHTVLRPLKCLLVLDNFEHLIGEVGRLIEMLQHASGLKILLTSRERPSLQSSCTLVLSGLEYPRRLNHPEALGYPAVRLFLDRAQRSRPGFAPQDQKQLEQIVRICQMVDGLPLGIELSAANLREYPLADIQASLQTNLNILDTNLVDLPARHRSLRAAYESSWERLSEDEKTTLLKLAVFRESFTPQAAREVSGATVQELTNLCDKSLLEGSAYQLFRLNPLLQHFIHEKSAEAPGLSRETRRAHAAYYLDLISSLLLNLRRQSNLAQTLEEIEREAANLRAAAQYAGESGWYAQLAAVNEALFYSLEYRGMFSEGEAYFQTLITSLSNRQLPMPEAALLGQALAYQGWFTLRTGRYQDARLLFEDSQAALAGAGAHHTRLLASLGSAILLARQTNLPAAAALLEQTIAAAQQNEQPVLELTARLTLAEIQFNAGALADPLTVYFECLDLADEKNFILLSIRALADIADAYAVQDKLDEASGYLQNALELNHAVSLSWLKAHLTRRVARLSALQGDPQHGESVLRSCLIDLRQSGDMIAVAETLAELAGLQTQQNELAQASVHFQEALRIALELREEALVLDLLTGIAGLLTEAGAQLYAASLLTQALNHPQTPFFTRQKAARLFASLQPQTAHEIQSGSTPSSAQTFISAYQLAGRYGNFSGYAQAPLERWLRLQPKTA